MDAAGRAGSSGHVRTWAFTPRGWLWAEQGCADSVLCSQAPSDGFGEDELWGLRAKPDTRAHRLPPVAVGGQTVKPGAELEEGTYQEVGDPGALTLYQG